MSTTPKPTPEDQAREVTRLLTQAARQGHGDLYEGKRREQRYTAPYALEADGVGDPPQNVPVILQDISANGLACWSKRKLPEEAAVRVREFTSDDSGVWLSARVTHCTPGIRGFLVGAEFDHPGDADALAELAAEAEAPAETEPPAGFWTRLKRRFGGERELNPAHETAEDHQAE
jgi:hypothetical protein